MEAISKLLIESFINIIFNIAFFYLSQFQAYLFAENFWSY